LIRKVGKGVGRGGVCGESSVGVIAEWIVVCGSLRRWVLVLVGKEVVCRGWR
jgi:hypothetical protein